MPETTIQQTNFTQPQNPEGNSEANILEVALGYFYTFVRPYIWLYPISVLLFVIGGIIYLLTATPLYESTAEVLIKNTELQTMDIQGIGDPTRTRSDEYLATQIRVICSDEVVSKARERMIALGSDPSMCSAPTVSKLQDVSIVCVTITSTDADMAAKFANVLVEVYLEFANERKTVITRAGSDLLRELLKEVQDNREAAQMEFLEFKKKNGIFDFNQSYNALVAQKEKLLDQLFENKLDVDELDMTLAEISENRAVATVMLPYLLTDDQNTVFSSLKNMELTHAMAKPELLKNYGEAHSSVKLHNEVAQLIQETEEKQVDISINGLKLRRDRLLRRQAHLNESISEIEHNLEKLDMLGGDFKLREATCTKIDETITMITNRINELQIADATSTGDFSVCKVNDAKVPNAPFFPQPKKVLGIAFILGLGLAVLISVILVSINNKVTDQQMVSMIVGRDVPIMGSIEFFSKSEDELLRSSGEDNVDEVFRDIRTSLSLSMMTRNARAIAISSTIPHEGKTFSACQLARSFSREGKRILLIDLDMRKPRVHKILEKFLPENAVKRGMSNVLVGDCKLEDIIIHIEELGIDVCTSGPLPPNPTELMGTQAMKDTLTHARELYDSLIIDTPPMLPVTDTMVLASLGIPLILISRLFTLPKPALLHVKERLRQLNLKLSGIIVNNADMPKSSYSRYRRGYGYGGYGYGYGGYGYGYGYGYGRYGKYRYGYSRNHDDDGNSQPDDKNADK